MDKTWQFNKKQYMGFQVSPHVDEISKFRIKYFREYPYLYDGNMEYEREYFEGFMKDPNALVITASNNNEKIVGVITGLPLKSDADILKTTEEKFLEIGENPSRYFYIGELIVDGQYRDKGVAAALLIAAESFAKSSGFDLITFSMVVREKDHPLKPLGYIGLEAACERNGYKRNHIVIEHHWPTIFADGSVKDVNNKMEFWVKELN